jgi:hypothetical protein
MLSCQDAIVNIDSLKHADTRSFPLHEFLLIYALSFALEGSDLDDLVLLAHAVDDVVERFFVKGDT